MNKHYMFLAGSLLLLPIAIIILRLIDMSLDFCVFAAFIAQGCAAMITVAVGYANRKHLDFVDCRSVSSVAFWVFFALFTPLLAPVFVARALRGVRLMPPVASPAEAIRVEAPPAAAIPAAAIPAAAIPAAAIPAIAESDSSSDQEDPPEWYVYETR